MKTKSLKMRIIFLLLFFVFIGMSNVFSQDLKPKQINPDKPTSDALSSLVSIPKNENTDRGSIQNNIKSAFLKWSQKSEFERQVDYEVRLQKQSKSKFAEICIEEIKKKINSYRSSDLNMNLLTYDAENEVFSIAFKFKRLEWVDQVRVPINIAQSFKENEWNSFRWIKEKSSWCFIDSNLFPSEIYLESNSFNLTFKLPLANQEEILIAFDDLQIENPYLMGYIFYYSAILEKAENIYSPEYGILKERLNYNLGTGLDNDGNYLLGGRRALDKVIIVQDCNQEGIVVVDIDVDRDGNVTKAIPGVRGTTNNSRCLLDPARQAALRTKFNSDPNAPARQMGRIIYRFTLTQ